MCFSDTTLPWSNRFGHVWTVCRENQWSVMARDDDTINALEPLDHRYLSQEGHDQFERFVCRLYTSNVYTKVNDFRWFLYSDNAAEGRVFPNDWLTNNAYSTSTLRSIDLEKGWGKPSAPSFFGRLRLGLWHDHTSLYSSKMFESSSSCSCAELGKVCLQTRMQ